MTAAKSAKSKFELPPGPMRDEYEAWRDLRSKDRCTRL